MTCWQVLTLNEVNFHGRAASSQQKYRHISMSALELCKIFCETHNKGLMWAFLAVNCGIKPFL